jgi:hypothetical protein
MFLGVDGEADDELLRQAAERAERIEKEKAAKNATAMALALNVIVPAAVRPSHPRSIAARLYLQGRKIGPDVSLYARGWPDDLLFSFDAFPDFKRPDSPLAVILLCRSAPDVPPRAIHRIMILGDGRPCYSLPKPGKPSRKQKFSLGSTFGLAALTCGDPDTQGPGVAARVRGCHGRSS